MIRQPKSSKSRRQVDLPPSLALLLRQHKAEQEVERNLVGKPLSDDDLVFSHPDGGPLDPGVVSHTFAKVLKKAGLPHIRFHDLRHTPALSKSASSTRIGALALTARASARPSGILFSFADILPTNCLAPNGTR